jgi:hydrogenase maturation protein HypF
MGRLFDVIAALVGIRQQVNYEAQAAIEMEALVDPDETGAYSFDYYKDLSGSQRTAGASALPCITANPAPVIRSILNDRLAGLPISLVAARFHNSIASLVLHVSTRLRAGYGARQVCLSGGVWQNVTLLSKTTRMLEEAGFTVYTHHQVPANDGGLALGQAVIAAHRLWAESSRISTEATSCA